MLAFLAQLGDGGLCKGQALDVHADGVLENALLFKDALLQRSEFDMVGGGGGGPMADDGRARQCLGEQCAGVSVFAVHDLFEDEGDLLHLVAEGGHVLGGALDGRLLGEQVAFDAFAGCDGLGLAALELLDFALVVAAAFARAVRVLLHAFGQALLFLVRLVELLLESEDDGVALGACRVGARGQLGVLPFQRLQLARLLLDPGLVLGHDVVQLAFVLGRHGVLLVRQVGQGALLVCLLRLRRLELLDQGLLACQTCFESVKEKVGAALERIGELHDAWI